MLYQNRISNKLQWSFILAIFSLFVFSSQSSAQCTLTLSSANSTQTICEGSAIANITYNTNATAATVTGVAGLNVSITGSVLTVSGTPSASGTYTVTLTTGCTGGTTTATGTITRTVPPSAGTLSGTQAICVAGTTTFTSTTSGGSWSSGATGIATVNTSTGVVTGVAAGTATITYTVTGTGGCANATATRTVTVTAAPIAGTLSGTQAICVAGTTTFTSTTSGGSWTTDNASIATVNSSTGVVSGVAAGTATITYTVVGTGGCANATATRTVTVTAAPIVGAISGNQSICSSGGTNTSTFTVTASGGTGAFTWTSSNTAVATVNSSTGVVTGVAAGTATITYTRTGSGGCADVTATRTVTVTAPPSAGTLNGSTGICINGTATYSSTVVGGSWTSSNTAVATINSSTGVISPVAVGSSTMTYTVTGTGGCANATATRAITITALPSAGTLSGNQAICIGATSSFTSTVSGGTWSSSNTSIATINSSTGVVTGVATGVATMTYLVAGSGGCADATATRTIDVRPYNTITRTSALATTSQDLCINTPITNITYSTTEATGVSSTTGLPNGVTAAFTGNAGAGTITVSGTPVVSGTFNYTITMTGGCTGGTNTATGSIIVRENTISLEAGSASPNQAVCFNLSPLPTIRLTTTLATGATLTGSLPAGVTGVWNNNVLTISGTPTESGIFDYTYNLTGGCPLGSKNDTSGRIIVNPLNTNTFSLSSAGSTTNQTLCINTPITNITYSTLGVLSGVVSNLPPGVSYTWSLNTLTISGTPTTAGVYNYQVMTTGACSGTPNPLPSATGTIVVTATNTIYLTSAVATTNQILCRNTAITPITYTTVGNSGVTVTGLPTGITASYNTTNRRLTISGTADTVGTATYTVTMSGGCNSGAQTMTGTIVFRPTYSLTLLSAASTLNQNSVCSGTAITEVRFRTEGATGAQFNGLPPGLTGSWSLDTVRITGTPTVLGTYIFRIDLVGGPCNSGTRTLSDTFRIIGNPITLVSAASTVSQTVCLGSPIVPIKYLKTSVTTGATLNPAFAGLTSSIVGDTIIVSGTPTSAGGPTNIVLSLSGSCTGSFTAGNVTRRAAYTIPNPANDSNQSVCRGAAIANIVYTAVTGATGALVTGLPEGVSAAFTGNATSGTITISGTPSVRGVFHYRINLVGGCTGNLIGGRGFITVTGASAVLNRKSSTVDGPEILTTTQTRCVGKPIQNIVVTTTGYSGAAVLSGFALPAGVTAAFAGNTTAGTVTISGTPTAVGAFSYQVGLSISSGCTLLRDTIRGTITVLDTITWSRTSASAGDTLDQFSSLDTIRYKGTKGATGALFSGLPDGLIGSWSMSDSTATIRGIPTVTGIYNYRVTFTGRCMTGRGNVASGTIKVDPPAMGSTGDAQSSDNSSKNPSNRVSVDVSKASNPLILYPVPTSGLLNVRGLNSYRHAKLSIVDQGGRVVFTQTWMKGNNLDEITMNLDFCPVGIYYLHISDIDAMFMDDLRERSSLKVMRFQIQR
jgi:uncharacterized protein YjdB